MSWLAGTSIGSRVNPFWLKLAGGGVLIGAVGVISAPFLWPDQAVDFGVVAEWNDTVARLGIDPVFPPEEDIYVGDLFAVVTADHRPGSSVKKQPLLNRAIKLDHLDLTEDLIQSYKALPIFPDTAKRPSGDEPWEQKINESGLFSPHQARGYLGIAAFPGFTIRHQGAVSGGLSAFGFTLGSSQQENDLLEVRIPFAETYGVPSALASGRLANYCSDAFTKQYCTDVTLRQHLSYVTPGLFETKADPETGTVSYLMDVEIALVNRVYLTRSIEQVRKLGRTGVALIDALQKEITKPKASEPAATDTTTASAQKQAQDILDRLNATVPGGLASLSGGSESQYNLKQTFQRPIVIGYRAVRAYFPSSIGIQISNNNQKEGQK